MIEPTQLYLIRHGATAANEQRPYVLQGQGIDGPLSEIGRKQAEQLGMFLADRRIDRVYCSPMRRAVETAECVAKHHNMDLEHIAEITEVDVGRWERMSWQTVMKDTPDEYSRFIANPGTVPYLGGESYSDVHHRVAPAIGKTLADHPGDTIVIIAHNVVNRVYLAGLLGLDMNKAKEIRQANTCINVIKYDGEQAYVTTMNSCFHVVDTVG